MKRKLRMELMPLTRKGDKSFDLLVTITLISSSNTTIAVTSLDFDGSEVLLMI
jgi:hypothetical protein